MIQACIFDLDGTLANTLASIAYFANTALKKRGLPPVDPARYRHLVGNGADRLMRGMLAAAMPGGFSDADVSALRTVYDALYESDTAYLVTEYPGVKALVAALHARGIPLAVLSNKPHNVTQELIGKLYPAGSFALCYGQREGVARKPAPDGALLIARELGVDPHRCLYIGDTDVDMKTGAAAGMETVGVLWGFRDRAELERCEARHIVRDPADILRLALQGREAAHGMA